MEAEAQDRAGWLILVCGLCSTDKTYHAIQVNVNWFVLIVSLHIGYYYHFYVTLWLLYRLSDQGACLPSCHSAFWHIFLFCYLLPRLLSLLAYVISMHAN